MCLGRGCHRVALSFKPSCPRKWLGLRTGIYLLFEGASAGTSRAMNRPVVGQPCGSFNHSWSNFAGAGPDEVFALSTALSRHRVRPFPQCVARSWISSHRRRAIFPALSRRTVWVFLPWQTSYPSDRRLDNSNPIGHQLPTDWAYGVGFVPSAEAHCFRTYWS